MNRIGFGGGCHWCTEAVFQFFDGVEKVEQGWIGSSVPNEAFSEAVVVHYNPNRIELETLIEAHLITHASTSNHRFRKKYRSAIYYFNKQDKLTAQIILNQLSKQNRQTYILNILPFVAFKSNTEEFLNYYQKNKEAPFCKTYIVPKLKKLQERFI